MVLRFVPVGARAQSVHRRPSLVLAAALSTLLLTSARAQEQPPATNPPANPPANAPATGAAPAAAEASATTSEPPPSSAASAAFKPARRVAPIARARVIQSNLR